MVNIKTTLPKMEDLNFTNPLKNGFPVSLFSTAFFNSFMTRHLNNEISPNLHSKFQLGVKSGQ